MNDSIESKESSMKIMQKEYQSQYDQEKIIEEEKHNKEMALAGEREKRQRLISIGTGFGLLVLLFFVVAIYKRYKLANYQKHLIQEKNEQITDSIQYAKRIQHASLTSPQYLSTVFDNYFVFYQPKDIVSGDFYWAHNIDEDQVMVAVCDCTGHGVPGAFMSMISNSLLNEVVIDNANYQPEKVLDILSVEVIKTLKQDKDKIEALDGLDMTLLKIDKKNRTVQFAGAGHTLYLLRDGKVYEEKGDPYPIGYFFGRRKPYVTKDLTLNKGDVLYLTSDGYIEQFGPMNKKKFGYQAFKNLLVEAGNEPIENQEDFFKNAINNWKANTTQVDDMLVMGIRL
jgi:serine phosphatase RsbU (regulator of sigma subunit)